MNDDPVFAGACLCEAVVFEIRPPSLWCAHCHCGMCRRAHGAAFVTWLGVPAQQFAVVKGEEHLQWFASSPEAQRGFCGRCGSTLLFQSTRWAGEMHVVLANIKNEVDRQPSAHVFFDSHVDWCAVNDDLPVKP